MKNKNDKSALSNIPFSLSLSLIVAAIAIGIGAWNGIVEGLFCAPFIVLLWRFTQSRSMAFVLMFAYYLAAGRSLFHSAGVFFAEDANTVPNWRYGAFIWIAPSALLALTWTLCWGQTRHSVRILAALFLISVPPIGVIGWANPITSAGALFPALSWAGLLLTLVFLMQLGSAHNAFIRLLPFVALSIGANIFYQAPVLNNWIALDTHLGTSKNTDSAFDQMQTLQQLVSEASERLPHTKVFVLPELVGGDWSINKIWWSRISKLLTTRNQTVLIGAFYPSDSNRLYVNALFSVGYEPDKVLLDRVPVPILMWKPFSGTGARAFWFNSGVIHIADRTVASLICYEELLIWPILISMTRHPDVLIGAANDWWAKDTSIPRIQKQVISAWARLFKIPSIWAHNE